MRRLARQAMRTARYANWLFNPLYRPSTPSVYELLGSDSPTSHALYLNLGYWRDAATLDSACEALVQLVGEAAQMGPEDKVVDCGFGFADQDIYWARRHPTLRITGLNVTPSQVSLAQKRVSEAGLSDRIDLKVASATAMPLDDASVDVVVALESAFHFRTRERFFAEAYRILRPGGRLATADIIPRPIEARSARDGEWSRSWRLTASRFAIPKENAYPLDQYQALLERLNFNKPKVRSIRDDVYAPLQAALRRDPQPLKRLHPLPRMAARLSLLPDAQAVFDGMDYIIATADKQMTE